MPLAVALPQTEAQVIAILKVCHQLQVPIVPRGSGTGLSGGAMPIAQGLVLSLSKLKKILAIDPFSRTATVQPGVRNLAISEAVAHLNLYYAPDPSSQIACSIGGNVSENSGGVHCLKYGLTLQNILRIRVVLMNGEVVEFGGLAPDAPGLDLLAILIGSEGMLGIVTEVTVKLVPKPQLARVIMASFADIEKGGNAVAAIIAAGIIPAGLEMMDKATTRAVEEFVHAGYDLNAEAILLCESDGTPEEVSEEIARIFGVPASMIGASAGIKSSVEQEYQDFYARTLMSYAINIEQELARKLLTENDKLTYYFKFNFNSLLRASANERADYYNKGIRGGWLSRNEARLYEDVNGFNGGEEYLIEANLMPSSQINAYMDAKIANLMATADKNNNPDGVNNLEIN
jgi:glycolate oxidase